MNFNCGCVQKAGLGQLVMVGNKDATHLLDVLGFFCPVPVAEAKQALSTMKVGSILQVLASDPEDDTPGFSHANQFPGLLDANRANSPIHCRRWPSLQHSIADHNHIVAMRMHHQ